MTEVDLLHPLASLEWEEYHHFPVPMRDIQSVFMDGKLYLGGGDTESLRDEARLYVYTPSSDTYDIIDTPVYWYSLAVSFCTRLLLVGGKLYPSGNLTNKVYMLNKQGSNAGHLPSMLTKRYGTSTVCVEHYIIVAGGCNEEYQPLDVDEIYSDHTKQWSTAQSLPAPSYRMKSTVHEGRWILMIGERLRKDVFTVDLHSLISTSESVLTTDTSQPSLWERLTNAPLVFSCPAVMNTQLLSIAGGVYPCSKAVHVYSSHSHMWVPVGEIPVAVNNTCCAVLPTGELMVFGGWKAIETNSDRVFKGSIKLLPFDIDNRFTLTGLTRLMEGIEMPTDEQKVIKALVRGASSSQRTWRGLLMALKEKNMDEWVEKIKNYMSIP